jgi:hypothetical protein
MFDDKSRYSALETRERTTPDGKTVVYVSRRFIPAKESYQIAGVRAVTDSDRLDLIAHRTYGVATGFWQLADANEAMHPDDLTAEAGRQLDVPIPRK